uniref:K Homology domain-containing protein n=1 Tax=Romanomermis culicivorax TaxID=13658 RepID=A0A915KIY2_ROMCU
MSSLWKEVKVRAPINIALVKYWGKRDKDLMIPLNDSLSLTVDALYAETHAKVFVATLPSSDAFTDDERSAPVTKQLIRDCVILNGREINLLKMSRYHKCFEEIRRQLSVDYAQKLPKAAKNDPYKLSFEITSSTNFPVAAGLASSAAGFAAIAYSLGVIFEFNVDDICRLARLGSGSAARSVYSGLVQWFAGQEPRGADCVCRTISTREHWPNLRCVVLVVSDAQKAYSSTDGMERSVSTISVHLNAIKEAFFEKNFDQFAEYVMRDSNQLHAVCADTFPPLLYLNDSSKVLINFVHAFNETWATECSFKNGSPDFSQAPKSKKMAQTPRLILAYSFDAGPNCCLFVENEHLPEVLSCLCHYFPNSNEEKFIRTGSCLTNIKNNNNGSHFGVPAAKSPAKFLDSNVKVQKNVIQYILVSGLGAGPVIVNMMNFNVLRPDLQWIEGRCYRKLPVKLSTTNDHYVEEDEEGKDSFPKEPDSQSDHQDTVSCPMDPYEEDESKIHFDHVDSKNLKPDFAIKMDVPNEYLRFIIGRSGETKRRLEFQTQTQIFVPRMHQIGETVIRGGNKMQILECRRRILAVVDSARRRYDPTHFLSIPFINAEIRNNFEHFKKKILSECSESSGIREEIFMKTAKLHLTIGVMVLLSDSERNGAKDVLDSCYKEVIKPALQKFTSKKFLLKGLDYMNDDPSEVNVLYAKVFDENGQEPIQLQTLVDQIASYFSSKNLLVRQKRGDNVKMHVTLMNARYAESDKNDNRAEPFDIRKVIETMGDFEFGFQTLESIRISQRFALDSDGYYLDTHRLILDS